MLLEFRISNYRSIAEEQVLSLLPDPRQKEYSENIRGNKHQALNGLALYGANSSGKSNCLKGLTLFDQLVSTSAQGSSVAKLPYDPYLLKEGFNCRPTVMEATIILGEVRYRYGFTYNQQRVLSEWLYRKKIGREVEVFFREGDKIEVSSALKGAKSAINTAITITRPNALFLSICDMVNIPEAKELLQWFDRMIYVDGLDTKKEEVNTIQLLDNEAYAQKIKGFLDSLNLGFCDLLLQKKQFNPHEYIEGMPEETKAVVLDELKSRLNIQVETLHYTYDAQGKQREETMVWSMHERESEGSRKAFQFSGPVLHTLLNGGILIVDEIEAKSHPIITLNILELFFSKKSNPYHAQIIFATHDTNLLHYANLRRDQINFVEKNAWEASEVFALSDYQYFYPQQKGKDDANKAKRYLEGRYGAIPVLGNFDLLGQ
ncbi:ATP-binding protein [Algivirga pacifica]|uniref:ATP-binding protein n=1 Tax=Algivirga pacifica TaxID=1162670 RepID=A0ABP9DIM6_9BACT